MSSFVVSLLMPAIREINWMDHLRVLDSQDFHVQYRKEKKRKKKEEMRWFDCSHFYENNPTKFNHNCFSCSLKTAQAKFSSKATWLITDIQIKTSEQVFMHVSPMFFSMGFLHEYFLFACSKCIILPITDCIIKSNYAELFWMIVSFFEQLTKEDNNDGCLVYLLHFVHFTQYHLKYCIFWLYRSTRPFEA